MCFSCNSLISSYEICQQNGTVIPGTDVLRHFNVERSFWENIAILVAIMASFRLLTYLVLRYIRKPRWKILTHSIRFCLQCNFRIVFNCLLLFFINKLFIRGNFYKTLRLKLANHKYAKNIQEVGEETELCFAHCRKILKHFVTWLLFVSYVFLPPLFQRKM